MAGIVVRKEQDQFRQKEKNDVGFIPD